MRTSLVVLLALLGAALAASGALVALGLKAPLALRELGLYYVLNTIRDCASPEAVAAIVWDYRGLDTIYETAVLYFALVGGLAIFRAAKAQGFKKPVGLTELSKTSTRLISLLIAAVSVCIALHGHLTPGGGFPGGSALAVVAMLAVPIYSVNSMLERGITSTKLIAVRGAALTALGLVALLPVIRGLEIVTNQRFYPGAVLGFTISGSISMYNFFEFMAVASGFAALALYLSIPEEAFREVVERG